MKSNDLSKFTFRKVGSGHYRVTYTTDRGDMYIATITDMPSIDRTLHAEWAKLSDIRHLAYLVRLNGKHYHSDGTPFINDVRQPLA